MLLVGKFVSKCVFSVYELQNAVTQNLEHLYNGFLFSTFCKCLLTDTIKVQEKIFRLAYFFPDGIINLNNLPNFSLPDLSEMSKTKFKNLDENYRYLLIFFLWKYFFINQNHGLNFTLRNLIFFIRNFILGFMIGTSYTVHLLKIHTLKRWKRHRMMNLPISSGSYIWSTFVTGFVLEYQMNIILLGHFTGNWNPEMNKNDQKIRKFTSPANEQNLTSHTIR